MGSRMFQFLNVGPPLAEAVARRKRRPCTRRPDADTDCTGM